MDDTGVVGSLERLHDLFGNRDRVVGSTALMANSRTVPEGSPVSASMSKTKGPPFRVSLVMPAISSAIEFAHAECPVWLRR